MDYNISFNNSPYLFLWLHVFIEIIHFICFEYYINVFSIFKRSPFTIEHRVKVNRTIVATSCIQFGIICPCTMVVQDWWQSWHSWPPLTLSKSRLSSWAEGYSAMLCFLFCRFHSPAPRIGKRSAVAPQPELMISSRLWCVHCPLELPCFWLTVKHNAIIIWSIFQCFQICNSCPWPLTHCGINR